MCVPCKIPIDNGYRAVQVLKTATATLEQSVGCMAATILTNQPRLVAELAADSGHIHLLHGYGDDIVRAVDELKAAVRDASERVANIAAKIEKEASGE